MIDNEKESFELIEKYRVIIENVNDLICIVDQDHPYKIKFINETIFLSLLNYSNKDLVDKSKLLLEKVRKNHDVNISWISRDKNRAGIVFERRKKCSNLN